MNGLNDSDVIPRSGRSTRLRVGTCIVLGTRLRQVILCNNRHLPWIDQWPTERFC
jgi:hypothetical protein